MTIYIQYVCMCMHLDDLYKNRGSIRLKIEIKFVIKVCR